MDRENEKGVGSAGQALRPYVFYLDDIKKAREPPRPYVIFTCYISIKIVTGPSLTISTCMWAPNSPVWVGTPWARSKAAKRSHSGWAMRRQGGVDEGRAVALARVGKQGELRDHDRRAAHIQHREVHLALGRPQRCAGWRSCAPGQRAFSSPSSGPTPSRMTSPPADLGDALGLPLVPRWRAWTRAARLLSFAIRFVGQADGGAHSAMVGFGDGAGAAGAVVQHIPDGVRVFGQLGAAGAEGFQVRRSGWRPCASCSPRSQCRPGGIPR